MSSLCYPTSWTASRSAATSTWTPCVPWPTSTRRGCGGTCRSQFYNGNPYTCTRKDGPYIEMEPRGLCQYKMCRDPHVNTLRPRQNGRHFADDVLKCIFLNESVWILLKISLKFVPKGPINNIPSLVQVMAWRRPGDKPLSEPMMVSLLKHICVARPQWVKDKTVSPCLGKMVLVLRQGPSFEEHLICPHGQSYCEISNISHTKSQNFNVSRLILQLSLPNLLKPGVKSPMKM